MYEGVYRVLITPRGIKLSEPRATKKIWPEQGKNCFLQNKNITPAVTAYQFTIQINFIQYFSQAKANLSFTRQYITSIYPT